MCPGFGVPVTYPEIAVASTKAFTAQLLNLLLLAVEAGVKRGNLTYYEGLGKEMLEALSKLPEQMEEALKLDLEIKRIAKEVSKSRGAFFIGRGTGYPLALEGALKLTEVAYIHASGLPAGELKHGPLALIEEGFPTIAIAPSVDERLFGKMTTAIDEIHSRGGRLFTLTDREGARLLSTKSSEVIVLPQVHPALAPILFALPLQLLAYHAALHLGLDIDQPRNLAKSVTVE